MNTNEAVAYVLNYMPMQITNACTIGSVLHIIFGDKKKMEIQVDRPITKDELNLMIRSLRK